MTRITTIATLIMLGAAAPTALAQMGPDLSWNTIDSGGGTSVGGAFEVSGTIGQPDAGAMSGGEFDLAGGFWPGVIDLCYPDCNDSGTLTIADFICFQAKFVAGNLYADCTQNGALTVADFICFQAKFVAGCP